MKAITLALLTAAGSCTALAAPRETVTFTDVPSITHQGLVDNATRSQAFTGTYTTSHLTVSGTIVGRRGATYANEASIMVTPPGVGSVPFVISPFTVQTYTSPLSTPTGSLAIPVSGLTTAGTWGFEFFEMYDDASLPTGTFTDARDTTWQTVTVTLNDGAVPALPPGGGGPSVTFSGVLSDGTGGTEVRNWNASATRTYSGLRYSGYVTALRGLPGAPTQVVGGQTRQAVIRVTPPGGGAPVVVRGVSDLASSSLAGGFIALPGAGAGTYSFDFYEWDGSAANSLGDQPGGADNVWTTVVFELADVPPPTVTTAFGTVGRNPDGTERLYTNSFGPVTGTRWISFVTTAATTAAGTNYVDIDSNGSSGDTMIGLFNAGGGLLSFDDDDGVGVASLLTFGSTTPRPPQGLELPRDGFNGELPAGTYYLASAPYFATFATPFTVVPGGAALSYVINLRTNLPSGPAACGASDVAGSGQAVGADGELTADDIIVFIGWFVANDARADVASSGQQPGGDGEFTADDVILFINRFIAGCP